MCFARRIHRINQGKIKQFDGFYKMTKSDKQTCQILSFQLLSGSRETSDGIVPMLQKTRRMKGIETLA